MDAGRRRQIMTIEKTLFAAADKMRDAIYPGRVQARRNFHETFRIRL
jgi:hypothetical protein